MITERKEYGKIEILPDGQIQLREDTVIERDGVEISRMYHRSVLEPSKEMKHADPVIASILPVLWTDKVIAAFEEKSKRSLEQVRKEFGVMFAQAMGAK